MGTTRDPIPGQLQDIVDELSHTQPSIAELPRRIELCERGLKLLKRTRQPELWDALHVELNA
jgi:hypothetical protein